MTKRKPVYCFIIMGLWARRVDCIQRKPASHVSAKQRSGNLAGRNKIYNLELKWKAIVSPG